MKRQLPYYELRDHTTADQIQRGPIAESNGCLLGSDPTKRDRLEGSPLLPGVPRQTGLHGGGLGEWHHLVTDERLVDHPVDGGASGGGFGEDLRINVGLTQDGEDAGEAGVAKAMEFVVGELTLHEHVIST